MEFKHTPVLLDECMEALNIKENGIYVDGTLGGGGHSSNICMRLGEEGRLYGFDQDRDAIEAASKVLSKYGNKFKAIWSNYSNIKDELYKEEVKGVDGILLDLGVSSYQLDNPERGFSYMNDGPLDMRMDKSQQVNARDIINSYDLGELYRVIKSYGEERYARNIAERIVKDRSIKPIETTSQLVSVVRSALPNSVLKKKGHPAKKTFQALRIEVNKELYVLESSLEEMVDMLNDGGRLAIITFHSLEDRIVKTAFKNMENPCTCPPDFPVCVCGKKPKGKVISRRPIIPSDMEQETNSRSKSAKLRVFERIVN